MLNIRNLQAIEVKFSSPTKYKGARVKLIDHRFNVSITLSYDYAESGADQQAIKYLAGKNFNVVGLAETKTGYMVLVDNFKSIKEEK